MRVLLINMPWSPIDLPSLALGILTRSVNEKVPGARASVVHGNLDYFDWLTAQPGFGDFTADDYGYYALSSYFLGCGDWVFSAALYDDPGRRVEEFGRAMRRPLGEERLAQAITLHRGAGGFVRRLAEEVVAQRPDVVGFTSTFQQNTAALAAARAVKQLAPGTVTVMGGANCDSAQGEAVHRNFPFVDYVVRGEGEVAFPALLNALRDSGDLARIPGLCWRDGTGSRVNPMATAPLPPAAIVSPDYAGYLERLAASGARHMIEPKLVIEGARGCWWGEKHHCTFCGLNGSFMQFRSKSPDAFYEEIVGMAREHRVLDMYIVDNILDMNYVTTLLPRLIDSGYDLRMHVEIKANMRREQLQTLADAGLVFVQPGIESLNTRVLGLMDKGVTGCQNVRMLRDGASTGLSVSWNYLYGFPGETEADYEPVIAQLPALEHLNPPTGLSARIAIERFSPYFNRPELGFDELRPAEPYRLTYDLPEHELFDLAYIFDAPPRGITSRTAKQLNQALSTWMTANPTSRLVQHDLGDRIVLLNRRRTFSWTTHVLDDPFELAAFQLLEQPRTPRTLIRKLDERFPRADAAARVPLLLTTWHELGLLFTDAGHHVHVVPTAVNDDMLRLGFMRNVTTAAAERGTDADTGTVAGRSPAPQPA
ncbi:RiPP maturation radical SAM C-methyltransferase [Streptomyces sp. MP131-18]|uniref:RiPP maturation radical SAM C-methyltransferase n=1 Tax=Streptomyces sp. MP131-18 TaxID=1857892 RepID=UPI00097C61CD|nr:RiPP maturation radical SAM C-methyltransferase [Streptomyces sp. MP131-18]ONK14778.1 bacteriocin maturation radical SAM protein 1 [Streptomyces sp. MP131-18]